jgi:hypothetical protein
LFGLNGIIDNANYHNRKSHEEGWQLVNQWGILVKIIVIIVVIVVDWNLTDGIEQAHDHQGKIKGSMQQNGGKQNSAQLTRTWFEVSSVGMEIYMLILFEEHCNFQYFGNNDTGGEAF